MISRKQFKAINEERWKRTDRQLESLDQAKEITPDEARKLPSIFRKACQDLGFCEERVYGKQLTQTINHRVMSLYRHLYRDPKPFRPVHFYLRTFPGAFKSNLTLFWISAALFWVPFFATLALGEKGMVWYQAILGADNMHAMEQMYGHQGNAEDYLQREVGNDFMMFAYYIANNVGIDFQVFAGGLVCGIGTLFVTIYNGLMIGASAGYVNVAGDPMKFWTFVCGHSAFELVGINVATMAGLKMGWSLISPGQHSRGQAFVKGAREGLVLIGGAAMMTFFAAFIEGFWSAKPYEPTLKFVVSAVFWLITILYLSMGRKEWYERT